VGALLDQFRRLGIAFAPLPGGQLNAAGALDDETRAAIRKHKAAILAELAAANDAATPGQADGLAYLIELILAHDTVEDRAEAWTVALADPDAALTSYRALAADLGSDTRTQAPTRAWDEERRYCTDCANLTTRDHRCLAAWRGERPGNAPRDYHPVVDLLRCCESYTPKATEPDQRTGAERWPNLTKAAVNG
jgi:hypothetical protein